MPSEFYCDCEKICKGQRKKVSRATFYNHARHRDPLSQFTPQFQEFIRGLGPDTTQVAESSDNTCEHPQAPAPSRSKKRPRAAMSVSTINTQAFSWSGNVCHYFKDLASAEPDHTEARQENNQDEPTSSPPNDYEDFANNIGSPRSGRPASPEVPDPPASPSPGPPEPLQDDPGSTAAQEPHEEPSGDVEDLWDPSLIHLDELKRSAEFVQTLRTASLDNPIGGLSEEALDRLRNPLRGQPGNLIDEDTRLAIDLYLGNPSEATYNINRAAILRRFSSISVPSYYRTRRLVADITGIESIVTHMCINSCLAYTGPFNQLDVCPTCSEPRYDQFRLAVSSGKVKIPRQEFHTIPIGPQIQALYRNPESARRGHYLREERAKILDELTRRGSLEMYSDILHGSDIIDAFQDGRIGEDDVVLMFSIDGAQLYAKKASACWIYIWVLFNLSPKLRYKKKHVFIGGFIPGPNNPKNTDSFIFPGLYHLRALQKERLAIWDAALDREVRSMVFLAVLAADGPGMMHITGFVGYHGKHGCRLYCGLPGRREAHGKHYFPALLKPTHYDIEGCDHPDIDIRNLPSSSTENYQTNLKDLLTSPNETRYKARRLATGISRPSIFSGLEQRATLGLPKSAGSDIMHLGALNIPDLLISLWRGTIDCTKPDDRSTWVWAVLRGDVWLRHGKAVADTLHYLPSSFDRPPRNIAEKLTSGYKAWEFLMYLYGLGPGLLLGVLPEPYYSNYCKLVYGMRLMNQHNISAQEVRNAQLALISFAQEFEIIYCQRLPTRIHFVRPCIHSLLHLPREVIRLGPLVCSSQWTLERTIGNLGEEIKQHSNPFANLSQRGIRRARVNALKAMIPDLDTDIDHPADRGSKDIGDGFVLLRAREPDPRPLRDCEADALRIIYPSLPPEVSVRRWAKLRIPTGQNCYSAWKEKEKPLEKRRTARNIKVCRISSCVLIHSTLGTQVLLGDAIRIAEVRFFIHVITDEEEKGLALVSLYTLPNPTLLKASMNTLWSCAYQGDAALKFIDVKTIRSVVSMIPHSPSIGGRDAEERFFLVEKPGFDVAIMAGAMEDTPDDEDIPMNAGRGEEEVGHTFEP